MKKTLFLCSIIGLALAVQAQTTHPQEPQKASTPTTKLVDPVCKMHVKKNKLSSDYKGQKYFFCSKMCKSEFDKTPDKFLKN